MTNIEIISGNLFDFNDQYICHQCNCVTNAAAHLAKEMFKKYPYADIYKDRPHFDRYKMSALSSPGGIIVRGNGEDQRYIINMLAQVYPGKPRYPDSTLDGSKAREKYFDLCLSKIALLNSESPISSIGFPFGVGCGAAGGDWNNYQTMIEKFAEKIKSATVRIYKLP